MGWVRKEAHTSVSIAAVSLLLGVGLTLVLHGSKQTDGSTRTEGRTADGETEPGIPAVHSASRDGSRSSDKGRGDAVGDALTYCGTGCLLAACRLSAGETKWVLVSATHIDNVWGTDEYSTYSHVGTAAVHAGLIRKGDAAVVTLKCNKARESQPATLVGSARNGVVSLSKDSEPNTFAFRTEKGSVQVIDPDAPVLPALPRRECTQEPCMLHICYAPGEVFDMVVKGSKDPANSLYGTHKYSCGSVAGAAAVHLGLVADGETAVVTVTCLGSAQRLVGSTAHGVTSLDFERYVAATFTLSNPRAPR
jgi:hypothetical protein